MRYFFTLAAGICLSFFVTEAAFSVESKLPKYKKHVLSDKFHAEGASYGDFNKDGVLDVVIGHYWYEGPNYRKKHLIFEGRDFDPVKYSECFAMFCDDFNGDGWTDILVVPFPGKEGYWYENNGNEPGLWKKHFVTDELGNESQEFVDLIGDGRKRLLFNRNQWLGFAALDPEDCSRPWNFTAVSTKDKRFRKFTHGIGYGDINGDGRPDLLEREGWWEQPADPSETPWTFHPFLFAARAAHLLVYDVDGDGLNDVVTALDCHLYGFAWYRQVRKNGTITFEKNVLIPSEPGEGFFPKVSQLHSLVLTDMNGDGIPDVVTGKRFWAHGPKGDVAPNDPAVLMWWETKRSGETATLVPHIIDEDSGVGTQFAVGDLNGDGVPDIVIGNKKGAFVFISE